MFCSKIVKIMQNVRVLEPSMEIYVVNDVVMYKMQIYSKFYMFRL